MKTMYKIHHNNKRCADRQQRYQIQYLVIELAFEIKALKAKIIGDSAGHTVAMVTYCITKWTAKPMTGQCFYNVIVT